MQIQEFWSNYTHFSYLERMLASLYVGRRGTHASCPEEGRWATHVVFIGYNHSIALDSRLYPRCKGNRIYFADHRICDDLGGGRGLQSRTYHDAGVCRMKDGAVRCFEYLSNATE